MKISWNRLSALADGSAGSCEIEGFACPIDRAVTAEAFILAPEPMCCIGCLPRDPATTIEVLLRHATPLPPGPVRLQGHLLRLRDDPNGWLFQMRDARIVSPVSPSRVFARRAVLAAGPLLCMGASLPADNAQLALRAIEGTATIDTHSHAGGVTGVARIRDHAPFTDIVGPMRQGGMAVICLAAVPDGTTHRVSKADGRIRPYRDPEPGELYAYGQAGLARIHDLAQAQGLAVIETAAQLRAARADAPGIIVTTEGADFLEGQLERVDEAVARFRVRHIQLTHYRVNELGDIQTEPPVHGGLTDFGAAVIARCNSLGVVVDVAHGTFDLVTRAARETTRPLVLSHTSLSGNPGPRSRTISAAHAKLIADTDGVVGIWPPISIFPDLHALAAGMARIAAVIGVAHVALGTDMRGLVGPSAMPDYDRLPALVAAMLDTGFSVTDIQAILGGNYARLFAVTRGA